VAAPKAPGQRPPQVPVAAQGAAVKASTVTVGTVTNEVSAVGSLLAEESVIIRPEIDGRLLDLHFQEGRPCRAGRSS